MYKQLLRFLPVILAMAFASCDNNKLTEKTVASFGNGQPSTVHYLDKNNNVVREAVFYENGALQMEGGMKDGNRSGEWKSYFPDGKVQSTGFFENGVRIGEAKVYHENGNIYIVGQYKDGKKVGEWIYYDEQGYESSRKTF